MNFLPPDRHVLQPLDTMGEALKVAAKAAWPWNTSNHLQRRWGLHSTTAENVAKGHGSSRTLIKAVRAEGADAWELWDAVGELIIGESRDQYDERKLQLILEKTAHARTRLEARRARRLELEAGSGGFDQVADR